MPERFIQLLTPTEDAMPGLPKAYDEVERLAKRVSEKTKYPIRDVKHFIDALGGEEASLDYQGGPYKVGEIRRTLPAGFFPIESEEDLIAKAAYLRSLRFGELEHAPGEERREPDKEHPEPPGRPEGKGRPGGIPALSGIRRKDAPAS